MEDFLSISGNAGWHYMTFRVGVRAETPGDVLFGSETTVSVSLYSGEAEDVEVQIGGLTAHDAAFGRQRAAAYLVACDIADLLTAALDDCGSPLQAFQNVAVVLDLDVRLVARGGNLSAVFADSKEES